MNIATPIAPQVLNAAAAMLAANIPDLTPGGLLDALKSYNVSSVSAEHSSSAHPEPPYSRKEAAEYLNVSLPTIDRYLAAGLLKRVRFTAHTVRITPESVQALIEGGVK